MSFLLAVHLSMARMKNCIIIRDTIKRQAAVYTKTAKQICEGLTKYADESIQDNCYEYLMFCPDLK